MTELIVHDKASAPEGSTESLTGAEKAFGFIPNLLGVFAESPETLQAYLTLGQLFDRTSFSATERQVILLTISRYNECNYCVAAHSAIAGMQNVSAEVVEAIRNDQAIADEKLQALREFTTAIVDRRGWVSADDLQRFLGAGYAKSNVLEVILAVGFKTLSNYTNHIAETPLDTAFAATRWSPPAAQRAS